MIKTKKQTLILILGALAAIGPFSIDMYLPAFSAISKDLDADIAKVGLTLSSFFIGISLGQLIYGPILDRFGRKIPLQIGLIIYVISCVSSALSGSIEWLITQRFLMALGGCAGMVATRAIIRDIFPVTEIAKIFSMLMLVMGIAPIIAPTVGGWVLTFSNWRVIFYILATFGFLLLLLVQFFLPESKIADKSVSLNPKAIFQSYVVVFKNKSFLFFTISGGTGMAAMFAYISGSPFVLMKMFHYSEAQYGIIFGLNAFGFILGSQLNRIFLKRFSSFQISKIASILIVFLGIALTANSLLNKPIEAIMLVSIFLFLLNLGLLAPNTSALALEPFSKNAGIASALIGTLQMIFGAVASIAVSSFHNQTSIPMAAAMGVCALFSFLSLTLVKNNPH